jgi:hypothetical protein
MTRSSAFTLPLLNGRELCGARRYAHVPAWSRTRSLNPYGARKRRRRDGFRSPLWTYDHFPGVRRQERQAVGLLHLVARSMRGALPPRHLYDSLHNTLSTLAGCDTFCETLILHHPTCNPWLKIGSNWLKSWQGTDCLLTDWCYWWVSSVHPVNTVVVY